MDARTAQHGDSVGLLDLTWVERKTKEHLI